MRIDLNAKVPEARDPGQSTKARPQESSGSLAGATAGGLDTAKFSEEQGRVRTLAAEAMQMPEIRMEKVAALQRALKEGSYRVKPEQAAEALLSSMQI